MLFFFVFFFHQYDVSGLNLDLVSLSTLFDESRCGMARCKVQWVWSSGWFLVFRIVQDFIQAMNVGLGLIGWLIFLFFFFCWFGGGGSELFRLRLQSSWLGFGLGLVMRQRCWRYLLIGWQWFGDSGVMIYLCGQKWWWWFGKVVIILGLWVILTVLEQGSDTTRMRTRFWDKAWERN